MRMYMRLPLGLASRTLRSRNDLLMERSCASSSRSALAGRRSLSSTAKIAPSGRSLQAVGDRGELTFSWFDLKR